MAKKKIKWGVIGAGGIADRRTIPGLLKAKNSTLEALMDVANVEALGKKYKCKKATNKLKDIVNDPEIDAVYIATPVNVHLKQIKACAEAGKHILCEKPLTLKIKEAKEAVKICAKNKVRLQEGYMMKFHGAHQEIQKLIKKGSIGKVTYMRAQLACWFPPCNNWRQDPRKGGGGALIDMSTHLYDLLQFLNGPIVKVGALTGNQVHNYKSEDGSTTILEFKNGAQATVDCFFNVPDNASRTRLEIYGSKGAILTEGTIGQGDGGSAEGIFNKSVGGYDAVQTKGAQAKFKNIPFKKIDMYTAEIEYMADCILNRKKIRMSTGEEGIKIAEITEKAYQSAKTG
ncbi:MAG: Gfo/Idh/MocA family protein, partial [Planctomycetota bacterium]